MKYIRKICLSILSLGLLLGLTHVMPLDDMDHPYDLRQRQTNLSFQPIIPMTPDETLITYTDFRNTIVEGQSKLVIETLLDGRRIRIDTAEELHRWSYDVTYHPNITYMGSSKLSEDVIEFLLSLDYVLGNDIDYSVMQSRQFIPIGYDFTSVEQVGVRYQNYFTGSFDGRGFEIRNLYAAGFDLMTIEEYENEELIELAIAPYYAMFPFNEGVITNLGLINPTFELLFENPYITKAANVVGLNMGLVENVYVIDTRTNILNAGIRMRAPVGIGASEDYEAAGIVYENQGIFRNAYYVSRVVVNGSFINSFDVQPLVFKNSGTIDKLVYNQTLYQTQVTIGGTTFNVTPVDGSFVTPKTDTELRQHGMGHDDGWYYYPLDRYPALFGVPYNLVLEVYEISNAVELVAFSKILSFNSIKNNNPYRDSDYRIVEDINMSQVAVDAYQTPDIEFSGSLIGTKASGNHYISFFTPRYVASLDSYSLGLFSTLSGRVEGITFDQSTLHVLDTQTYYGINTYVGIVAGRLIDGEIYQVSADVSIKLGQETMGQFYIGGIVGQADGYIEYVYTKGDIYSLGLHQYSPVLDVNPRYHYGGIVGATSLTQLTMYNAKSEVNIEGLGSQSSFSALNAPIVYLGGVIGRVTNTQNVRHQLGGLLNEGDLSVRELITSFDETQYVGGVIGLSEGNSYTLNSSFGDFTNKGFIDASHNGSNQVIASGVLVANHNEATELIGLYNYNTFHSLSFNNFKYTSLVYNLGTTFTLSQAANYGHHSINAPIDFSGVYVSEQNAPTLLRFVENQGNIDFSNQTISNQMRIAGITLSLNVDFLNVYYKGVIRFLNNQSPIAADTYTSLYQVAISGITHTLSSGRYLKNALNEGEIFIAGIHTVSNIYVGGLTNFNESGNLDPSGNQELPRATIGILNSLNYANILSYYDVSTHSITGLGNTFVGGITTFNNGSIQDVANIGDIKIRNNSGVQSSQVTFQSDQTLAGRIISYRYGVVVGGVAAAVMSGNSRIYDITNSGEIIAFSRNFARAGGILGVALYQELTGGGYPQELLGADTIRDSILSNGINYGNISALTQNITLYNPEEDDAAVRIFYNGTQQGTTFSIPTRISTQERPGIYASAGGVIGYGLSVMRRMISHGQISSTDVAGGIVGATYVGATMQVFIDTAINYGTVRAFNHNLINGVSDDLAYASIAARFYDVNDPFIFPTTRSDIRLYPEGKRGIGGIFGRLQRGLNQYMRADQGIFDFIVNTDPNVDLIGRLDQVYNFSSSARFFVFPNSIYYSARENDTTQTVFTGYTYSYGTTSFTRYFQNVTIEREVYRRTGSGTWWRPYRYYQQDGTYGNGYYQSFSGQMIYKDVGGTQYYVGESVTPTSGQTNFNETWINEPEVQINANQYPCGGTSCTISNNIPLEVRTYDYNVTTTNALGFIATVDVPIISESPSPSMGEYLYDENFVMRDDTTLVGSGEPITSYIYYIENALLSDTFKTTRPNGMYVLSTSSGSSFGSVIPSNLNLFNIFRLNGLLPYDTDYELIKDRLELDPLIVDRYYALLQSQFNDRSELLEVDQDIQMVEDDGSQTTLFNPNIDYQNKIITFDLSLDLISDEQASHVSYRLTKVLLPSQALIAMRLSDYSGSIEDFMALLSDDATANISSLLPPDLSIDLTPYLNIIQNTTVTLGHFTSYAEAAVFNDAFIGTYTTDYEVRLNLKPRQVAPLSPAPYQYHIDGGAGQTWTSATTQIAQGMNQSIRFTFRDPQAILNLGSNISQFVYIEYQGELVDPLHYQVLSEPVSSPNNQFGFSILLDASMRGGLYKVYYKYYFADQYKSIDFTKNNSNVRQITQMAYNSFNTALEVSGTTLTSYVNFGYELNLGQLSITPQINPLIPGYKDQVNYTSNVFTSFTLSPFATLTNYTYQGFILIDGYRRYQINYTIISESGQLTTYTHYIIERSLSIMDVFKNNNRVNIQNVFATREALQTNFAIDFGVNASIASQIYNLESENPDAYVDVLVTGQSLDMIPIPFDPSEILGITYSADRFFNIIMSDETLAGKYFFTFTYYREGIPIDLGQLTITKNRGIDAYLTNIQFSQTQAETDYPNIFVSNAQGVPLDQSTYSPSVYFAGIDYDGSKNISYNFRLFGQVANTPLNEYIPFFLDYLPQGATVARRVFPLEDPLKNWTDEVGRNADTSLISQLAADFTVYPDTGLEPISDEDPDVIITYRVTSEDGQTIVYYHITVVDIIFNVSLIFEVWYDHPTQGRILANHLSSPFIEVVLPIRVQNFNTNIPVTNFVYPNVSDFPVFNQLINSNNIVHMFYMANTDNYRYRFGRNISGFYGFHVNLPNAQDGYFYSYDIEYNGQILNDLTDYVSSMEGKYFYIHGGIRNRTRRFDIIITLNEGQPDSGWGLDDNKNTWGN